MFTSQLGSSHTETGHDLGKHRLLFRTEIGAPSVQGSEKCKLWKNRPEFDQEVRMGLLQKEGEASNTCVVAHIIRQHSIWASSDTERWRNWNLSCRPCSLSNKDLCPLLCSGHTLVYLPLTHTTCTTLDQVFQQGFDLHQLAGKKASPAPAHHCLP